MRKIKRLKLTIFTAAVFGLGVLAFTSGVQAAAPKCGDGIDNDNDGKIDFGAGAVNDSDCISAFDQSENSGHPFLLVTEDMYGDMRTRAGQSPWKEMKAEAINNCLNLDGKTVYDPSSSPSVHIVYGKAEPLSRIMNGCALAYILDTSADPNVKQSYFNKYKQGMENWVNFKEDIKPHTHTEINPQTGQSIIIRHGCPDGEHGFCVGTGSAFVMSIIATDIFYNKLSVVDRNRYEGYFGEVANRFKWPHNDIGTQAVWSIYKKDGLENEKINLYLDTFFEDKFYSPGETNLVSSDGAYAAGSYYALHRILGDKHRAGKFGPVDISTFTGYYDFTNDERFENLFQWIIHFTLTPNKLSFPSNFGDGSLFEGYTSDLPKVARLYTLDKWSADLAGHAAWLIKDSGKNPYGETSIFAYVNDKVLPTPVKPNSRIFPNGGAAFWENDASDNSLMSAIQSMDITEWHTHNEANSIYIYGYGEHLITNPGSISYGDPCFTPDGAGHNMTNSKFNSNVANTIAISWVKHGIKAGYTYSDSGKGISQGFVSPFFDYASADSGLALPNGHHQRNFIFVHPEGGKNNGYYVLFDEVATMSNLSTNTTTQVYLHPLSDALMQSTSTSQNLEYKARIQLPDLVSNNETNASISIFLGTPPSANLGAQIKKNDANGVVYVGKPAPSNAAAFCRYVDYLRTNYDLDLVGNTRKKNIVTILFPSDDTHPKALMSRLTGTNYSGAEISHSGSVKDYAIESSAVNPVIHNGIIFQGLATMYRLNNNENEFYFVRQGKEFNDGKPNKKGFTSNNPVSVYLKDKIGKIIVPATGATLTFFYPGITGVKIDGVTKPATTTIAGTDQPKEYAIEILTGTVLNPADVNNDTFVNIKDIQVVIQVIIGAETNPEIIARTNVNGDAYVNIKDIQAIIQRITNPN